MGNQPPTASLVAVLRFERKNRDAFAACIAYVALMKTNSPHSISFMQKAFAVRDKAQDGRFVAAVSSTGIYCRPSCPARRPRPEHVSFFRDADEAEAAGYRPCMRCRPEDTARDEKAVKTAIKAITLTKKRLSLAEIARLAGYSPAHFQRIFKHATGLSPAAYIRALRQERAFAALSDKGSVSEAIYDAGFEASSRFYDAMKGKLGMTPSVWVKGGAGVTIRWAQVQTSLAPMLVAATDKGVCRLSFNEGKAALEDIFPNAELEEGGEEFSSLLERVISAVEVPGERQDIPLDVKGTAFQEAVWRALREIPAGETRSYAEIAATVGSPGAVRAAGSANGANNVAVLIPCHRVVRSDGSTGGYAYGTEIKEALLARERRD